MERNVNIDIYLTLSKEGIKATKENASKRASETYGDEEPSTEDTLLYEEVNWFVDEMYFDKETESIELSGEFSSDGKKLGYLCPSIHISSELLIEIIEHYMKKMGKLKTVMEALK